MFSAPHVSSWRPQIRQTLSQASAPDLWRQDGSGNFFLFTTERSFLWRKHPDNEALTKKKATFPGNQLFPALECRIVKLSWGTFTRIITLYGLFLVFTLLLCEVKFKKRACIFSHMVINTQAAALKFFRFPGARGLEVILLCTFQVFWLMCNDQISPSQVLCRRRAPRLTASRQTRQPGHARRSDTCHDAAHLFTWHVHIWLYSLK